MWGSVQTSARFVITMQTPHCKNSYSSMVSAAIVCASYAASPLTIPSIFLFHYQGHHCPWGWTHLRTHISNHSPGLTHWKTNPLRLRTIFFLHISLKSQYYQKPEWTFISLIGLTITSKDYNTKSTLVTTQQASHSQDNIINLLILVNVFLSTVKHTVLIAILQW